MSNPFDATRYHSLVIKKETWTNPDFEISAWTAEGEIMGVRHKTWPLHGVQFHPESLPDGGRPDHPAQFPLSEQRAAGFIPAGVDISIARPG